MARMHFEPELRRFMCTPFQSLKMARDGRQIACEPGIVIGVMHEMLERLGVKPNGPLTSADYAGLPMPKGLWE